MTEAELIGAENVMTQILSTRYFLEAQRYGMDKNILYQNNMSVMILEITGRNLVQKTRNILTCANTS